MVTNLSYFFETAKKLRGGKWVWVKDSNGETRGNVLLGGTIMNPKKGYDHLYAAQLVQYTPGQGCLIFRSFAVKTASGASATTLYFNADGYGDAPEAGMVIMKAPASATGTGQSAVITNVEYDATNERFEVTIAAALGALSVGDIIVEATGTTASASAKALVPKPNTFIEADRDLLPTEGYGVADTANYSISTVYNKQAWIERMQPLPSYVLANNRSLIDGIYWI